MQLPSLSQTVALFGVLLLGASALTMYVSRVLRATNALADDMR